METVVSTGVHAAAAEQKVAELPSGGPHSQPRVAVASNDSEAFTKSPDGPSQ